MGALPLLVLTAALGAGRALAHGGAAEPAAADPWRWSFEAWLLVLLASAAVLYAAGVWRLWRQAGAGRGIARGTATAFAAGWLSLAAALVSPLDALGSHLFAAHMVQHELLMIVAAPLLVIGRPLAAWTWALPAVWRQRVGSATRWRWLAWLWSRLTRPLAAWALHALALWVWHVPRFFEAALHEEALHVLQHASFLLTALLFWWSVLGGEARSRSRGFALGSLFTTMLHTGALGALLTFAPTAWYATYAQTAGAFGLSAVEDQQLGGLIMWVPGGLAYLLAGLAIMARLLQAPAAPRSTGARPALPR